MKELTDPSEKDPTVVKSNCLIQAGYRLSLAEQRVLLAAIAKIGKDDEPTDRTLYEITASGLIDISDMSERRSYQALAEAVHRLWRREVRIERGPNGNEKGPKGTRITMTRWVQSVDYLPNEGRIKVRFATDILPYLSLLQKEFTQYRYRYIARMHSTHGIRLYELLMQWRQVGERNIDLDNLRRMFGVSDQYPNIRDLKRRVIEPAVRDVNECSDLKVEWSQRKAGRRVVAIRFAFQTTRRERAPSGAPHAPRSPQREDTKRYNRPIDSREAARAALAQINRAVRGESQ